MADTYSQIYIQVVFAVKGRANLIPHNKKDKLYKYITGIVTNEEQKLIAINGMPDHIHILIGLKPNKSLSDLVREMKSNSSRFINEKRWTAVKFEWQKGFGAFSYGHSQLTRIIKYIQNQENHHRKISFNNEYSQFLELYNIPYNPDHTFKEN